MRPEPGRGRRVRAYAVSLGMLLEPVGATLPAVRVPGSKEIPGSHTFPGDALTLASGNGPAPGRARRKRLRAANRR